MYRWIGRLTSQGRGMQNLRRLLLWLPRCVVFALTTLLGWGIFAFAGRSRQRILRNMQALLPQANAAQRRRWCHQYIVHECLTILEQTIEYRRALSLHDRRRAHFLLDGQEHLDQALAEGRGAILYTPHVGNYFYSYWMLSQLYNCTTVVTAGSGELRNLFVSVYSMGGMAGYDYDNVKPRELAFKLRSHLKQNGVVFLLSDYWREEFPDTQLFGKPSKTPAGALTLALLQKAPIVPFYGKRESWSRHRLVFKPPLHLHEHYDMAHKDAAMVKLSEVMEQLIGEAPEQWLYWFNVHERWGYAAQALSAQA